jgi:hypothetical protein
VITTLRSGNNLAPCIIIGGRAAKKPPGGTQTVSKVPDSIDPIDEREK